MPKPMNALDALPFSRIGRHPDLVLAIGVSLVVAMMILPMPTPVVDVLLALNLAFSAVILVASLMSEKPLAISTFPTLLLFTTLFRLTLNVSTTRSILTRGTGGEVVRAFGEFVLRGDVVVGLVIFLVITLVQFMVVAKGAERVAEVGARFTLDAMPGKQMSIDAAVRSGAITEEVGQERREELGRESQFYGAMDGAMKFIKGDAIAGLVICAINLVAGMAVGVLRNGLDLGSAAQTYSVLTVGDGLISQIPALLITLASGVLTTRVAGSNKVQGGLAGSLQSELLANPKVLFVGAGLALALGVVPGFPTTPFLLIALVLGGIAGARLRAENKLKARSLETEAQNFQKSLEKKVKQAKAQRAHVDVLAPTVIPICLDLDPVISEKLGFGVGADDDVDLLATWIPKVRDHLFMETGVRVPGIRVRAFQPNLGPGTFVIRINEVPMAQETLPLDGVIALDTPDRLRRLGLQAQAAVMPITGVVASIVPAEQEQALRDAGIEVRDLSAALATVLSKVLYRQVKQFVGLQETAEGLERLEKVFGPLVKETVPRLVSLAQLADIRKRLVDEGVSIRDMRSILEAIATHAPYETNPVALTEYVRGALSAQIAHQYVGLGRKLGVVTLDPVVEDSIHAAIVFNQGASYLSLDPALKDAMVQAIYKAVIPVLRAGTRPVILTRVGIRRYVRKLLEINLPEVSVLSYEELPAELQVQPLGLVTIDSAMLVA